MNINTQELGQPENIFSSIDRRVVVSSEINHRANFAYSLIVDYASRENPENLRVAKNRGKVVLEIKRELSISKIPLSEAEYNIIVCHGAFDNITRISSTQTPSAEYQLALHLATQYSYEFESNNPLERSALSLGNKVALKATQLFLDRNPSLRNEWGFLNKGSATKEQLSEQDTLQQQLTRVAKTRLHENPGIFMDYNLISTLDSNGAGGDMNRQEFHKQIETAKDFIVTSLIRPNPVE